MLLVFGSCRILEVSLSDKVELMWVILQQLVEDNRSMSGTVLGEASFGLLMITIWNWMSAMGMSCCNFQAIIFVWLIRVVMQTMVPGFWSSWLYNNGCQNEAIADQETLKDHMWLCEEVVWVSLVILKRIYSTMCRSFWITISMLRKSDHSKKL